MGKVKFDWLHCLFVAMNIIVPFTLVTLIIKYYQGWQNTEATIIGLCICQMGLVLGWRDDKK